MKKHAFSSRSRVLLHGIDTKTDVAGDCRSSIEQRADSRRNLSIKRTIIGSLIMLLASGASAGSNSDKPYQVAIWLIPAQEQRSQIQHVISDLAAQYSSPGHSLPAFSPHMTLCTGVIADKDVDRGLRALFDEIDTFATNHEEFSLSVMPDNERIDERKKQWTQFLFLHIDKTDAPQEALNVLDAKKAFRPLLNSNPDLDLKLSIDSDDEERKRVMLHVSLMYNGIEDSFPDIRKRVQNKREYVLPDQVVFESIQVVTPRSGQWRDVLKEHPNADGDWEVLYTMNLKLPPPPLRMVMAGGQTGIDQAAWRAARLNRILIGGWCPPGRHLGYGQWIPSYFPCQETRDDRDELSPTASQIARSQRTEWNVRDADATLILRGLRKPECTVVRQQDDLPQDVKADVKNGKDLGTGLTVTHALDLRKYVMICDPDNIQSVGDVVNWLRQTDNGKTKVQTLNVGGPSEATQPGIGASAEQFLLKVFAQLRKPNQ